MFGFGIQNKLRNWQASRKMGAGNQFTSNGFLSNCSFEFSCSQSSITIATNSVIENVRFLIHGTNNHIVISNNVTIKRGILWIQDNNSRIQIGSETTIEGAHIAVTEDNQSITIGEDCMLSHGISIRTGDSHAIIDLNSDERINRGASIILENHVWVGANVTILKGITVGSNSIIGTGAIVTKNIDRNCIYSGVPAIKTKESVTWTR